MKSFDSKSRSLSDLECGRDPCRDRAVRDIVTAGAAFSLDKHNTDENPSINKNGDDLVEAPGVDESESESGFSCILRERNSASS